MTADQIGCQRSQSIMLPVGVTILNYNISAFDEPAFT
jgi:hypothetical protein